MTKLKELREFMNLTKKDLSKSTGLSTNFITKVEDMEDLNELSKVQKAKLENGLKITVEELEYIDLKFLSDGEGLGELLKEGDLDIGFLYGVTKLEKVRKLSKIGKYNDTFYKNYSRIPDGVFDKLSAEELAILVDEFYDSYSAGRNHE